MTPLDKLNTNLKRYLEIPDNRTESGKQLLLSIVECVNQLYLISNPVVPSEVPVFNTIKQIHQMTIKTPSSEAHIPIMEFIEEYRINFQGKRKMIASDGAISAALRMDQNLVKLCAKRGKAARWFIQPKRFIEYVSQSKNFPKLRNRCLQWLKEEEMKNENGKQNECCGQSLQAFNCA